MTKTHERVQKQSDALKPPTHPNPLLQIPIAFDQVSPAHVAPAVQCALMLARSALGYVTQKTYEPTWSSLAWDLDLALDTLSRIWGAVQHLHHVIDSPDWRQAYNAQLSHVTEFWSELGADAALFQQYKNIDQKGLNPIAQRALQLTLRDFQLSGAHLKGHAQKRWLTLQTRQAELSQRFSENVLDATQAFVYLATEEEMAGVPDDVRQSTCIENELPQPQLQPLGPRYRLTLQAPVYGPVLQHAHNRSLRERLYRAHQTRASEFGPSEYNNQALMTELLCLRHEEASLLGYTHFGELSLASKMAGHSQTVVSFLHDLAQKALPFAQSDLADVRAWADQHGVKDLQPFDWAYFSEQLRVARFAFSDQEVKSYFPLSHVLKGLFGQIQSLFDIELHTEFEATHLRQNAVWNPAVQWVQVCRGGNVLGYFSMDLHARTGKREGAWMDDAQSRWRKPLAASAREGAFIPTVLQLPIAHLVCNFSPKNAQQDTPDTLLTHDEVMTLFHECGHVLHHVLTRIDERGVSGISGVEWDAVELPSQFLENLCWDWDVLSALSHHHQTGEALPRELFDKMRSAKHFQSGWHLLRQVELALLDWTLHSQPQPQPQPKTTESVSVLAVWQDVRAQMGLAALWPLPDYNRMPYTFSHIFTGGYAAGYYSYLWAQVLSADAYAALEEAPDAQARQQMARRYRQEVVEVGGSRPAAESFQAFRGRSPHVEALLRQEGLFIPEPPSCVQ
jgi:oligopeptidase A